MDLYIANTREIRHEFMYIVLGNAKTQRQPIPPRCQIKIPNLSHEQIDAIVKHHAPYGLAHVSEIASAGKRETPSPLIYAVDQRISGEQIERMYRANLNILEDIGAQTRKQAAIASNDRIAKMVDEANRNDQLGAKVNMFQATVIEEEGKDGYASAKPVAESLQIGESKTSQLVEQPAAKRNPFRRRGKH